MNGSFDLDYVKKQILNNGVFFGEYAPGRNSRILYDTRLAIMSTDILSTVGTLMWQKIKKYNPKIIYGKGVGAFNLLSSIKFAAEIDGYSIGILFVRDGRKETNRMTIVEGKFPTEIVDAVAIDDLINTGDTIRSCQQVLQREGIKLNTVAIACVIDFWTYLGSRRFEVTGTPVESLFTRHDFGDTRKDPNNSCVDSLLWRNLDNNQWDYDYSTKPMIDNDRVYYGNDKHRIYCHDIYTGGILWTYQCQDPNRPKGLGAEIVVSKNKLFISSYDGSLYCLNKHTGTLIWKKHLDYFVHSAPYIDQDNQQIYIATEGGINNHRGDIVCLDLQTSQTKWRYATNQVVPCSPTLINGMVICGSNDENLYAIDHKSGYILWVIKSIGEIKGRVCDVDGVIIVSNETGVVYGIDYSGNILWQKSIGTLSHHQMIHKYDTMFVVASKNHSLFGMNNTGEIIWYKKLRDDANWNISQNRDEICVITKNGHMNVIDILTGEKKSHTYLDMEVSCPCDFNDKYIAINTVKNGLFLYER